MKSNGFVKIGNKIYQESIGEMKHADRIIERLLVLEGLPNLQDLGKLLIGETVPEMLGADLLLEKTAHQDLVSAITECEQVRDFVTRDLLAQILSDAEEHIDFLETELALVASVGIQNYLQSQMNP
jgi:bacterioferritin